MLVAYLNQEFTVLRVKNRFYGDTVVEVTAEQILASLNACTFVLQRLVFLRAKRYYAPCERWRARICAWRTLQRLIMKH